MLFNLDGIVNYSVLWAVYNEFVGPVLFTWYCNNCNGKMAGLLQGNDVATMSIKFLLKGIPDDIHVTESLIRLSLKQKKYTSLWILLNFMDTNTALVSVRVPRKSKNTDFVINIKGRTIKAHKLSDVEEDEFELMLNSTTAKMFYSADNLRKTVEKTIKEMMQVENHDLFVGKTGDIKYDLLAATSKHYEVYCFGSRIMGLGFENSDYDVFIDMGNYYRGGGETKIENSVQLIRDRLMHKKGFTDLILIPRARTPILKVKHSKTQIRCDISTTNGIGVENSKLLKNYLSDRRVRFVTTAVKIWTKQMGLTQIGMGPGSITSYCMLWLVLYALMQDNPPAVMPVVKIKQAYHGQRLFIDGWDCSFCASAHPKTKNTKSEIELLHHFFNFYGSMNFKDMTDNVICPYLGSMIPVKQFVKTNTLSDEFQNYKKQVSLHRFYEMRCDSVICVQDPIEQGHNIAKAVDDWVLDRFLKLCKTTAQIMENAMLKDLSYLNSEQV